MYNLLTTFLPTHPITWRTVPTSCYYGWAVHASTQGHLFLTLDVRSYSLLLPWVPVILSFFLHYWFFFFVLEHLHQHTNTLLFLLMLLVLTSVAPPTVALYCSLLQQNSLKELSILPLFLFSLKPTFIKLWSKPLHWNSVFQGPQQPPHCHDESTLHFQLTQPISSIWHHWPCLPSWTLLWFGFRDTTFSWFSFHFKLFYHLLFLSLLC